MHYLELRFCQYNKDKVDQNQEIILQITNSFTMFILKKNIYIYHNVANHNVT